VNENDWLNETSPGPLFQFLLGNSRLERTPNGQRKIRLFACACCRRAWHLIEPHPAIRECVEFAEEYADGRGAKKRLKKLVDENYRCFARYGGKPSEDVAVAHAASAARSACSPEPDWVMTGVWREAGWAIGHDPSADSRAQAALVRCIVGNPLRPVALDPSWRTSAVVALADGIYADRAFDRLPILADALQDAGCDNEDVLAHCRADGPHARGCWVVDLLLGKSKVSRSSPAWASRGKPRSDPPYITLRAPTP